MPLDQSIVFDGGWRILSGQVPFRDFTTPSGLVPIMLQAAFFKLFGLTWLSYCLHAAVFNGLFCALAYALLRVLEAPPGLAVFYAALSSVVFYPPFGVPYMDQHAFFFSLVFVFCLAAAARGASRWRSAALVLLPLAAVLAFLSKQIPTAFLLPLVGLLPFFLPAGERVRSLLQVSAGALGVTVGLAGGAWLLGVDRRLLVEYFFVLPAREGEDRISAIREPALLLRGLHEAVSAWGLVSLVPLGLLTVLFIFREARAGKASPVLLRAVLAGWLILACALFSALTNNEEVNGVAYVFISLGLAHAGLASLSPGTPRRAVGAAILALAALDAARFNARVNATRIVHGLKGPPASRLEQQSLPPVLSFLVWRLPDFYTYGPADLGRLVSFLRQAPGNFFLLGDTSILYGLTGRPSVSPSLWFHRRLSLPGRRTEGFRDYEDRLLARLRRLGVRYVVLEGTETFNGTSLDHFPVLRSLVERGAVRQSFGPFHVIEVSIP